MHICINPDIVWLLIWNRRNSNSTNFNLFKKIYVFSASKNKHEKNTWFFPLNTITCKSKIFKIKLEITSHLNKLCYQTLKYFFSECNNQTDCPNGGKNYICFDNSCQCPLVLDGDNCVGMLEFYAQNLQTRHLKDSKRTL